MMSMNGFISYPTLGRYRLKQRTSRSLASIWLLILSGWASYCGSRRANDFRSRAMAVGAHENRVVIYTLKSMEQIRKEVQRQNGLDAKNFMPIHEVH